MKQKKFLIITAILLIFLALAISIVMLFLFKTNTKLNQKLEHSQNEIEAKDPQLLSKRNDDTFEIVGYGQLEIDDSNPNINLINSSENNVYLSFDVLYNNEVLYKTNLISPGQMEQYDIYSKLDAGQHTLTYSINVYDVNENILWSGIQQEQMILIKK